jgi:hypothetical protein
MPEIVQAFLIYLIVQGLKGLGKVLGFDVSGWASVAAAVLVGAIVAFWSGLVAALPPAWQEVANAFMALAAAILAASGFHYTLKQFAIKVFG